VAAGLLVENDGRRLPGRAGGGRITHGF
jgi:hypothetical protein